MAWVNLDDRYPEHPKIEPLSDGAFRLQTSAICYANHYLTDGHIPARKLSGLVPRYRKSYVDELVKVGLWEPTDGGYLLHDYLDWNRSRKEVEAFSKKQSERGKAGARKRWQQEQDQIPDLTERMRP